MSKDTMKAVVFHGKLDVRLEDRPIPKIIDPTDVIVKVRYSALCGRLVLEKNTLCAPIPAVVILNYSPCQ
jgi:D-arabinose 1-dehydrogenase-like Zn-dependent alcohol dehydrogenase